MSLGRMMSKKNRESTRHQAAQVPLICQQKVHSIALSGSGALLIGTFQIIQAVDGLLKQLILANPTPEAAAANRKPKSKRHFLASDHQLVWSLALQHDEIWWLFEVGLSMSAPKIQHCNSTLWPSWREIVDSDSNYQIDPESPWRIPSPVHITQTSIDPRLPRSSTGSVV